MCKFLTGVDENWKILKSASGARNLASLFSETGGILVLLRASS